MFAVLDLVCSSDNFASADDRESTACASFALYNNVSVLRYLGRTGFYWDEMTYLNAVKANSMDCFGKRLSFTHFNFQAAGSVCIHVWVQRNVLFVG